MNQNQNQDFQKLFRTELEVLPFEISDQEFQRLMSAWNVAVMRSSLKKLDCDIQIFKEIVRVLNSNGDVKFTLFNSSFLFNAISQMSAIDLGVSVNQYINMLEAQKVLTDRWNETVAPIRTKLMNKLQTQAALQAPKNGMSVIPGKGR